jgi:hypothetical protein
MKEQSTQQKNTVSRTGIETDDKRIFTVGQVSIDAGPNIKFSATYL